MSNLQEKTEDGQEGSAVTTFKFARPGKIRLYDENTASPPIGVTVTQRATVRFSVPATPP
jgi:hypothetical protein